MAGETRTRELTREPIVEDENALEQLAASVGRIETGLQGVIDALSAGPWSIERAAMLAIDGPEPTWLTDMRSRYEAARKVGGSVVVVPRRDIATVLTLIDLARDRR